MPYMVGRYPPKILSLGEEPIHNFWSKFGGSSHRLRDVHEHQLKAVMPKMNPVS